MLLLATCCTAPPPPKLQEGVRNNRAGWQQLMSPVHSLPKGLLGTPGHQPSVLPCLVLFTSPTMSLCLSVFLYIFKRGIFPFRSVFEKTRCVSPYDSRRVRAAIGAARSTREKQESPGSPPYSRLSSGLSNGAELTTSSTNSQVGRPEAAPTRPYL